MKTRALYSALLMSLFLATAACTPRDGKVVDDQTRLRINMKGKDKTKGRGQRPGGEVKLGSYAMAAFLVEKQLEAVELIQLATGVTDPVKTPFKVSAKIESEQGYNLTMDADKVMGQYSTGSGDWKMKTIKKLGVSATVVKSDNLLQRLAISGTNLGTFTDKDEAQGVFFNDSAYSYSITLEPSKEKAGEAVITVAVQGTFTAKNGGSGAPTKIRYTLKQSLIVDKATLGTHEVKVVSSDSTVEYKYKTTVSAKAVVFKMDAGCNQVQGSFKLDSDRNKLPISYTETDVKVGNRWTQPLAACSDRPTVDLGRLFVF